MNKNIRLLIGASSLAALAIVGLQGCGSDSDTGTTTPKAGTSGAGAPAGGAPSGGSGGASAGAPAGGASAGSGTAGAAAGSGAGGASAGSGGASAGSGGSSAGSGGASAGSGGSGGAPSAACTTFCGDEETVCMFTGANAAYASKAECLSACATFTPGTGNSGNTLACRQYHVTNAKTMGADVHCPHTAKVSHNKGSAVTATDGPCN